jgi:hypothetical protein
VIAAVELVALRYTETELLATIYPGQPEFVEINGLLVRDAVEFPDGRILRVLKRTLRFEGDGEQRGTATRVLLVDVVRQATVPAEEGAA